MQQKLTTQKLTTQKEHIYFDNAATSWPKPEHVYNFMDSFFRSTGVNPGRSGYALAHEAEQMIMSARSSLARFFGYTGDSNHVVFALNATDALNTAISGLVQNGDHIVSTRTEHNAVLRTLHHLHRDNGVEFSLVAADSAGYIDPADIKSALKHNTRAVVLNHASNVSGAVQPLAEIAEVVRQHGAKLILDTAQSAGHIPVYMSKTGVDILTFTGHKGLFGPSGIGGMIVAEDVSLRASRFGGTGIDSSSKFQPDSYPHRLEAGTQSLIGIAGLYAAQQWFNDLGKSLSSYAEFSAVHFHQRNCNLAINHIHAIEMQHLTRIRQHLDQLDQVRVLGAAGDREQVATLSFTVDGKFAQRIADELDADYNICVRAGLHCAPLMHGDLNTSTFGGAVRVSPGFFTEEADIQAFLNAIEEITHVSEQVASR